MRKPTASVAAITVGERAAGAALDDMSEGAPIAGAEWIRVDRTTEGSDHMRHPMLGNRIEDGCGGHLARAAISCARS